MSLKAFLNAGAAAASAWALFALPATASAEERGPRWGREDAPRAERQSRPERPQRTMQAPVRSESAPAPQRIERSAPIAQQRSAPAWNRSDRQSPVAAERSTPTWNRSNPATRDWSGSAAPSRTVDQQATVPTWDRAGRNRTYSDPNRNSSYGGSRYQGGDRTVTTDSRDNQRTVSRSWTRDNDRDGRSWNRNGDNRSWSRDRDRDRDHRWDGNRDYRSWSRDWRSNSHYDWHRYRERNRTVFRIGRYYAPYYGYSYSRIGIGFYLDNLFFGSRYWINDPGYYRLPPAYGPYRWVRYYNDVLLVDIYSGEVVDVIYGFFW